MATGTVKWFSNEKGFGFITPDEQRKDCSCTTQASPATASRRPLAEGAKVSYDAENGPKGPTR